MTDATFSQHDENLAYERAVLAVRRDPAMKEVVENAFLHEDHVEAYRAFLASEHWARVLWLLEEHAVAPPARIVDFGGGHGLLSAALAASGYDVVLCEINPSDICGTGAAKRLREAVGVDFAIEERGVGGVDAPADAIVCRAVLHHLEPLVPTLAEVRRALRPGGAFIASDEPTVARDSDIEIVRANNVFTPFGVTETAYPAASYVAALRDAGFVDVRVHHPTPWRLYRPVRYPDRQLLLVALGYARFRVRNAIRRAPGDVRAFTAAAPHAANPGR